MTVKGIDTHRKVLHLTTEVTPGLYVPPVIGTTRAVKCDDLKWEYYGTPKADRSEEYAAASAASPALIGALGIKISFTLKLTSWGDTSSLTDHELAPFFASLKMVSTAGSVDGDDLTMRQTEANTSVVTCSAMLSALGGNDLKVRGGVGAIESIKSDEAGGFVFLSGYIMGLLEGEITATTVDFGDVVYSSQIPILSKGVTFTDGGIPGDPVAVGAWEWTPGLAAEPMPDAQQINGFTCAFPKWTGYPMLKVNVNAQSETDYAVFARWKGRMLADVSMVMGPASSAFGVECYKAALAMPEQGDGDGVDKWDLIFEATHDPARKSSCGLLFS